MPPAAISRALNRELLHLARRLAVAALTLIVLLYCGLRAYTVYLTHYAACKLHCTA
jgi:GR25 family glycosyltransferase involved in LPS biosynthesis